MTASGKSIAFRVAVSAVVLAVALAGCPKDEGTDETGQNDPPPGPVKTTSGGRTVPTGVASDDTDTWPQFRGANRDGIVSAASAAGLYRSFPAGGPKELWRIKGLADGYSGAAIHGGKVYFQDYDEDEARWMLRCHSLADGEEIWRWSYRRVIRPSHGITRAVPAVDEKYVFALDPKCKLHAFDAAKRTVLWSKNLVADYGADIPAWYNGQNPLIEEGRVVIGVGGEKVLMTALNKADGKPLWETPNAGGHKMSHSSVMPATLAGRKQYVWCTMKGLLGVDAADGKLLWEFPWKADVAVAPSALPIGDGQIFMSSGYKAGSVMIRVTRDGEAFVAKEVFRKTYQQYRAECHTPVLWKGHLFAVLCDENNKKGLISCLALDGKIAWQHSGTTFGLGGLLMANEMLYVMEGDTGTLRLMAANPAGYKELGSAGVLEAHEAWGPMAYANGKLILRGFNELVCIEIGDQAAGRENAAAAGE